MNGFIMSNLSIIGNNAKIMRESNGFSQAIVAGFLKIDQSLISKFESGERSINAALLEKLANLYGCRVSDFNESELRVQHTKIAFDLSSSDLQAIHDIKRIALNAFFMTELLNGSAVAVNEG